MKNLTIAMLLSLTVSNTYGNAFFSKINHYINTKTGAMVELSEFDINQTNQTGTYFSYAEGKKLTVNLSDLSMSTRNEINGVKGGRMVLVQFASGQKPCDVFYLFENGMAQIACNTGKMVQNIGVDRPQRATYIVKNVELAGVIAEVLSLNGVNEKDYATLTTKVGVLNAGTKVRVEVIFGNGEALVQKMGINFLDTSDILAKYNIEKVNLSDLQLN